MNDSSHLPSPPPGWDPNQNVDEEIKHQPVQEPPATNTPEYRPQPTSFAPRPETREEATPNVPYPNSSPVGDKTKKKKKRKKVQVIPFITMVIFLIFLVVVYSIVRSIRVDEEKSNLNKVKAANIEFKMPQDWVNKKQKAVSGSKERIFVGKKHSSAQGMFIIHSELKKKAEVKDKAIQSEIERKLTKTGAGKLKKEFKKIGGKEAIIYSYRADNMYIQSGFVFDGKQQWQLSCQYQNKVTQKGCNTILDNIKF